MDYRLDESRGVDSYTGIQREIVRRYSQMFCDRTAFVLPVAHGSLSVADPSKLTKVDAIVRT